ncbi:hypothetical protein BaRGS_00002296, partial [Batillaria attramentaria]
EILDIAYDYTRRMEAVVSYVHNPNTEKSINTSRSVMDFDKRKIYSIPADDPSKCYVLPNPYSLVRCIPDDAQYLGSTYLGPVSALPYDGWRFKMTNSDVMVTIAMSTTGCVPLVEGVSSGTENKTYLFTAFQPGIKNPEWFDLPASCASEH